MIYALLTVLAIEPVISVMVSLADYSLPLLNQVPRLPWISRRGYEIGIPVSKSYPKATRCANWTRIRPKCGSWRLLPIFISISTSPLHRLNIYLP